MKKHIYILFHSFYLILGTQYSPAQNTDSLWKIYNNKSQSILSRLKAIDDITWPYINNNPDTAILLARQELDFANTILKGEKNKWAGSAYKTLGIAYTNKGNYPNALQNFLKALKVFEEIGDKKGTGACFTNIGAVYQIQGNYTKALEYYLIDLKIAEEIDDEPGIGECLNNIGLIYYNQSNYPKALEYYFKALKIQEKINYKEGMSACYGNIGNIYAEQANQSEALKYYLLDLTVRREINDLQGIGICYVNIGELYIDLLNFKLSILYSDSCIQTCQKTKDINLERSAYENLATANSHIGKYKEAYENHVKFKTLTDSIFNAENSKQLGDMKTQFEVEKKEAELKIKAEAQEAISAEEKKKQQIIIFAVAGVLLLVLIFTIFLFNRFRVTQKQKQIIEKQKVLVDVAYENLHEKNKEVMDSIYYARRIQRALITSEKYIARQLNRLMTK